MARSTISSLISQARNWGRNLLDNFISGVKSKFSDLKSAVNSAASTVKNFLGFSSPTKEGPGRTADEWAPNFIKMYAQGILQNSGIIQNAVGSVAQQLAGVATLPTNSSQAVGTPATSAGVGDIYVYIGNEQIDAYIYKSQDRRSIRSNGRG
jgi:phage-related protein